MRLMLVCAALCVCYPIKTSENLQRAPEAQPQTVALENVNFQARYPAAAEFVLAALFSTDAIPQRGFEMPVAPTDVSANDEPDTDLDPPRTYSKRELCSTVASVAEANNLPVPFFANLIQQESGFKPNAVSPAGALGIAQFMPAVAAEHGLNDPFDPVPALHASGKFLSRLKAQFGNLGLAAAAYNAGARRVQDWMAKRGKLPAETRTYVRNITGHSAEHWARRTVKVSEHKLPFYARCAEAKAALAEANAREAAAARPKSTLTARVAAATKNKSAARTAAVKQRATAAKRVRVASR
jgi:soluble lytic murein transglycosylase-like protein